MFTVIIYCVWKMFCLLSILNGQKWLALFRLFSKHTTVIYRSIQCKLWVFHEPFGIFSDWGWNRFGSWRRSIWNQKQMWVLSKHLPTLENILEAFYSRKKPHIVYSIIYLFSIQLQDLKVTFWSQVCVICSLMMECFQIVLNVLF